MPHKKFDKQAAEIFWKNYSKNLSESIASSEKEGSERGYSSFEIERLWQEKTRDKTEAKKSDH